MITRLRWHALHLGRTGDRDGTPQALGRGTPGLPGNGVHYAETSRALRPRPSRTSKAARNAPHPHAAALTISHPPPSPGEASLAGALRFATVEDYFDQLLRWLELEAEAERRRMVQRRLVGSAADAERTGETLLDLVLDDHRIGLGGRFLLSFRRRRQHTPLPWNRLKVGSPVILTDQADDEDHGLAGVISRRTTDRIEVALEQWPEGDRFRVDLSPDEATRRRQRAALQRARTLQGAQARLRDTLLGFQTPRFADATSPVQFFAELNPPQQEAVRFALAAHDVAIIHGPPGTGKTTTLAEVIYQAVKSGQRVLACASSNTAVDNLLEKLANSVADVVRVGHPARVFESLRGHTLDELVEGHPSWKIAAEMMREAESLVRAASRPQRSGEGWRRAGKMRGEARALQGQARAMERQAVSDVLNQAAVICTTTTIDDDLLGDRQFELAVIDEACQATEASVWQAALRARRVILAGDHFQLPPTVLSETAVRQGMRDSMMQRLVQRYGTEIYRRLTVQYRMHQQVMQFSSEQFYDSSLVADASVRRHRLCDLPGVANEPRTTSPAIFIDTAGAGYEEQIEPDGLSKLNPKEAGVVVALVRRLIQAGIRGDQIAIIAPYAAQVRLLRGRLNQAGIEVDTVDGFQGREKELVIVTLVRSNSSGEIGFLSDTRRTNVALTRARRCLVVVGDSATLGGHPFYAALLEYFESIGGYHSVWDETAWQPLA